MCVFIDGWALPSGKCLDHTTCQTNSLGHTRTREGCCFVAVFHPAAFGEVRKVATKPRLGRPVPSTSTASQGKNPAFRQRSAKCPVEGVNFGRKTMENQTFGCQVSTSHVILRKIFAPTERRCTRSIQLAA